jgi:glycosyltransferase involved in cell wall biosynthesis
VKASLSYLEAVLTRKQERRAFLQRRLETLRRRLPTKGGFSIALHDDRQSEIEFSVIIPIYNRARLLPRAVRSILEQRGVSLHQIEVVICDDGSTDNPREVLEETLGQTQDTLPIQVIWLSLAHSGFPGPVRNAGMAVARGHIIAFLDSDDRWLADHLRTMKGAFDRNPELGMVITRFRFSQLAYAADGRLIETYQKPPHTPRSIITDCVAIRRSVFSQMGGFGEEDFAEDYYYWHRLMSEIEVRRLRRKTAVFSFLRGGDHLSYRFERLRSRYA